MNNPPFTLEQYLRVFGVDKKEAPPETIQSYYIKVTQKYPVAVLECQNVHLALPITKIFKTSEDLVQYTSVLCQKFNMPRPAVSIWDNLGPGIHGLYNGWNCSIHLKKSTTFISFLHEFSHHTHRVKLPDDFYSEASLGVGGHNSTFVGIYSEVMRFWNSLVITRRAPADFLFE